MGLIAGAVPLKFRIWLPLALRTPIVWIVLEAVVGGFLKFFIVNLISSFAPEVPMPANKN